MTYPAIRSRERPAAERRKAPRSRCFAACRAEFPDNIRTLDVTIRNLTDAGALLECAGLLDLPQRFTLVMTQRGVTRPADLRWRRNNHAGVAFADAF